MQSTIGLPTAREMVQEQRDPIYKLSHISTTQLRDKITTKTCWNGSWSVSCTAIITILATQKNIMSLAVSSKFVG